MLLLSICFCVIFHLFLPSFIKTNFCCNLLWLLFFTNDVASFLIVHIHIFWTTNSHFILFIFSTKLLFLIKFNFRFLYFQWQFAIAFVVSLVTVIHWNCCSSLFLVLDHLMDDAVIRKTNNAIIESVVDNVLVQNFNQRYFSLFSWYKKSDSVPLFFSQASVLVFLASIFALFAWFANYGWIFLVQNTVSMVFCFSYLSWFFSMRLTVTFVFSLSKLSKDVL